MIDHEGDEGATAAKLEKKTTRYEYWYIDGASCLIEADLLLLLYQVHRETARSLPTGSSPLLNEVRAWYMFICTSYVRRSWYEYHRIHIVPGSIHEYRGEGNPQRPHVLHCCSSCTVIYLFIWLISLLSSSTRRRFLPYASFWTSRDHRYHPFAPWTWTYNRREEPCMYRYSKCGHVEYLVRITNITT